MFRSMLVLIVAVLAFFGVLAAIVLIGSIRLRHDWASAGAPVDVVSTGKPPETKSTDRDVAPALPADSEPGTQPAAADPTSIYLAADRAQLTGKAKLIDLRKDDPNKPKAPPSAMPAADESKMRKRGARGHEKPNLDNKVWIAGLRSPTDSVQWPITLQAAGNYEIELIYGSKPPMGGEFTVEIAGQSLLARTEVMSNPNAFRIVTIGTLALPAGETTLLVRPAAGATQSLMNLKGAKLVPAS